MALSISTKLAAVQYFSRVDTQVGKATYRSGVRRSRAQIVTKGTCLSAYDQANSLGGSLAEAALDPFVGSGWETFVAVPSGYLL